MIKHLTIENFDKEIQESKIPVVVDFWASWCGPCRMLAPILEEVDKEAADKALIAKVNVDEQQELSAKFKIMSIPTILIFKNGKEAEKVVGLIQKEKLIDIINKHK